MERMNKPEWMTRERIEACLGLFEDTLGQEKQGAIYLCYDLAHTYQERLDMGACLMHAGIADSGAFNLQIDYMDLRLEEDWGYVASKDERRIEFLQAILDTGRIPDAKQMPCFKRIYLGNCPD